MTPTDAELVARAKRVSLAESITEIQRRLAEFEKTHPGDGINLVQIPAWCVRNALAAALSRKEDDPFTVVRHIAVRLSHYPGCGSSCSHCKIEYERSRPSPVAAPADVP